MASLTGIEDSAGTYGVKRRKAISIRRWSWRSTTQTDRFSLVIDAFMLTSMESAALRSVVGSGLTTGSEVRHRTVAARACARVADHAG